MNKLLFYTNTVKNNSLFFYLDDVVKNYDEREENIHREIIKRKGSNKSIYLKRQ